MITSRGRSSEKDHSDLDYEHYLQKQVKPLWKIFQETVQALTIC